MLVINTRNKLAVAHADFTSHGMLRGTCLGEALQTYQQNLSPRPGLTSNLDEDNKLTGPDGNGEDGRDLDLDDNNNNNGENDNGGDGGNDSNAGGDGSPGPADGPPVFSEVVLAHKRGMFFFSSLTNHS